MEPGDCGGHASLNLRVADMEPGDWDGHDSLRVAAMEPGDWGGHTSLRVAAMEPGDWDGHTSLRVAATEPGDCDGHASLNLVRDDTLLVWLLQLPESDLYHRHIQTNKIDRQTDRQTDSDGMTTVSSTNKKAELSQRRPHDAPNIRMPQKISRVLTSPRLLFQKFITGVYCDRY